MGSTGRLIKLSKDRVRKKLGSINHKKSVYPIFRRVNSGICTKFTNVKVRYHFIPKSRVALWIVKSWGELFVMNLICVKTLLKRNKPSSRYSTPKLSELYQRFSYQFLVSTILSSLGLPNRATVLHHSNNTRLNPTPFKQHFFSLKKCRLLKEHLIRNANDDLKSIKRSHVAEIRVEFQTFTEWPFYL